jgi:hypothetical protein
MTDPDLPVIFVFEEVHEYVGDEALVARMRELARLGRIADVDIRPEMPMKQYATLAEFVSNLR